MGDRPVTLVEAVHARTGSMLRTGQVVAFVQAWAVVRDRLGREPTLTEYAEWWKQPYRSAKREMARFREAFPEFETPAGVLDAAAPIESAQPRIA